MLYSIFNPQLVKRAMHTRDIRSYRQNLGQGMFGLAFFFSFFIFFNIKKNQKLSSSTKQKRQNSQQLHGPAFTQKTFLHIQLVHLAGKMRWEQNEEQTLASQ